MRSSSSDLQMGNTVGNAQPEPYHSLPSPPAPASSVPPVRPLRSILRPAHSVSSAGGKEYNRRSVVFADEFSTNAPSSNCQPFRLGERVTHFGTEITSTQPQECGGDDVDSSRTPVRKKRAPSSPPRMNGASRESPAGESVEEIRKKMRLDLEQSRAEYERLRSLRVPLRRRDGQKVVADTSHTTVPYPQPLRSLSYQSDIDKQEVTENPVTAELTKILTDFHIGMCDERPLRAGDPTWSCHSSDSGISNSLDEYNGYVVIEASQPPSTVPVSSPTMPPPPPPRRFPPKSCSGNGTNPTFRVPEAPPRRFQRDARRSDKNVVPTYCIQRDIRHDMNVNLTFRVPASRTSSRDVCHDRRMDPTYSVPSPLRSRVARSESDLVPAVRLPVSPAPSVTSIPSTASSEPLFAFGEPPVTLRSSSRRSMNDSFRRVRSSFGRFFGSIGRSASQREKRRPASVAFGPQANDFFDKNRPLDTWTSVGSALDTAMQASCPSAHEALDDHLASVWHSAVRCSHEELRNSNPSLFGDEPLSTDSSHQDVLHMTHAVEGRRNLSAFQS